MKKIPQIIHYCWFGGNPKPYEVKKYIRGWKKKLPDYTFVEWNEQNFPIEEYPFAKQAYEAGKYAFVSDVARVFALSRHGGIYLDTDVEVLKDFSECLEEGEMVLGLEDGNHLMTAFLASVPHHPIMERMMRYYQENQFKSADGNYETLANTWILTGIAEKRGFERKDEFQRIADNVAVFPEEYFSAYELRYENRLRTENTYTIHHFSGTWMPWRIRMKKICKKVIRTCFGDVALRKILTDRSAES